jgi:hypothetical protein
MSRPPHPRWFNHLDNIPWRIQTKESVQVRGALKYFVTSQIFYGEGSLGPRPTPKLEDKPFSAVRNCLYNIFAAALRIWRPSPPSATWGRAMRVLTWDPLPRFHSDEYSSRNRLGCHNPDDHEFKAWLFPATCNELYDTRFKTKFECCTLPCVPTRINGISAEFRKCAILV